MIVGWGRRWVVGGISSAVMSSLTRPSAIQVRVGRWLLGQLEENIRIMGSHVQETGFGRGKSFGCLSQTVPLDHPTRMPIELKNVISLLREPISTDNDVTDDHEIAGIRNQRVTLPENGALIDVDGEYVGIIPFGASGVGPMPKSDIEYPIFGFGIGDEPLDISSLFWAES